MLNLCLAVLSSALVSITMRLSKSHVKKETALLAVNYLLCSLFAWGDTGFSSLFPAAVGLPTAIGLGFINGFLFLAGFVLLQWSIRHNGVVLSATFQKLGLLVSMVASVACFGEQPEPWQWFAFALAVAAIVLMNFRPGEGKAGSVAGLLLLLLAGGGCDAMSKVFEVYGSAALSGHFLLYTFLVALGLCILLMIWKRQGLPGQAEWVFGLIVGVPNYYAAKFLLASLASLPAVIVYPVYSVATLLSVTFAGVVLFRERLIKRQWLALGMILAALVLLNI